MNRTVIIAIAFVAIAVYLARYPSSRQSASLRNSKSQATSSEPSRKTAAVDDAPDSASGPEGQQSASAPHEAIAVAQPTASTQDTDSTPNSALLDVLGKYSGTRDWTLDVDDSGRAFKITGGKLKDVMSEGPKSASFLRDLEIAIGLQTPPEYTRTTRNTSRVAIVDLKQGVKLPSGEVLEVYGSSLRLIGDSRGDAFLVYNELRPVSGSIRWASQITEDEALTIAKSYLRDGSYRLEIHKPIQMIYAHQEPHQKVTQVLAKNGPSTRLLFVGHDTRNVVMDQLVAIK